MKQPSQDGQKLLRLLEPGTGLGEAEDEVMVACEYSGYAHKASPPMEMLVWGVS